MKFKIGAGIAVAIAIMFILITPLGIIGFTNAKYPIGSINATVTFGAQITALDASATNGPTGNSSHFYGPANSMAQTETALYLGFIRNGWAHVNISDYGTMDLYTSTDGLIWGYNSTLVNVTHRDVRNYAAGTTQTGRIFVFYQVVDIDNISIDGDWTGVYPQYKYSDDDGITWSANQTLSVPTIDGFTPITAAPHGEVKQLGLTRIGLTIYAGNASGTHLRFVYSDDDGSTWSQVDISSYYPLDDIISEGDIAYLDDDRLVVMCRVDGSPISAMFTSIDNGLTWAYRGDLDIPHAHEYDVYPASLATFTDMVGQIWVLAIFAHGDIYYTTAYADDIIANGIDSWTTLTSVDITSWYTKEYPTAIFDSSGHGIMMMNKQINWTCSDVIIYEITANNILTSQQLFIVSMVDLIGLLLVIGMVAAIALVAVDPLKKKKPMTIEHLLNLSIYIIMGTAVIGIYYSLYT